MRRRINGSTIAAMIPAGIALNWVANYIVEALKIPLFLNNMGSIINAIVLGPWWGVLTAALTNIILALTVRWTYIPFMITGFVIALVAYWFFKLGWFKNFFLLLLGGAIDGALATVTSSIISTYVFGGFTGNTIDIFTAGLLATGRNLLTSTFLSNLIPTVIDKVIQFYLVWVILRSFPNRYLPNAKEIKAGLGAKPV